MADGNPQTVTRVITDPDFQNLSLPDQKATVGHFDPEFGSLSDADFQTALQGIRSNHEAAYQKAVNTGPYAPAGQAEKAMGQEFGDNQGQAKQALKSTAEAAVATAAGIGGARVAAPIMEAGYGLGTDVVGSLTKLAADPEAQKEVLKHFLVSAAKGVGYTSGGALVYKVLGSLGIHIFGSKGE